MLARLAALCLALLAPVVAHAQSLKVMSFNVRLPVASDGANAWENRRDLFVETIARADPDIIGTQELWKIQGDYVVRRLPEYRWFGIDRRGGHADEHMGVFYRSDRLKLIEHGDFWLSDTPQVPASISWGNLYPRMVTWGLFETRKGRRFYLLNTHFPYREQDDAARERCARLLLARIAALPAGVPVVLTGDFNTGPDTPPHALLAAALSDTWTGAAKRWGPEATFHAFTGRPDRRIDWILTRGFAAVSVRTVDAHRGALYPSDHFPVIARLDWLPR